MNLILENVIRKISAGCIFLSRDTNRIGLARRSQQVNNPGQWAVIGGQIDKGETIINGLLRELKQELGMNFNSQNLKPLDHFTNEGRADYYTFLYVVDQEFVPRLNHENDRFKWFSIDEVPNRLHFRLGRVLKKRDKLIRLYMTPTTESTGTGSSGQYGVPLFGKPIKREINEFKYGKEPYWKGGSIVRVDKKCKKYPYCNQGATRTKTYAYKGDTETKPTSSISNGGDFFSEDNLIETVSQYTSKSVDYVKFILEGIEGGATLWRSIDSQRKEGLPGKHFALSEDVALRYGTQVEKFKLSPTANIVDFTSDQAAPLINGWGQLSDVAFRRKAKHLGIDGIYYDFDKSSQYGVVIFDLRKIKKISEELEVTNGIN